MDYRVPPVDLATLFVHRLYLGMLTPESPEAITANTKLSFRSKEKEIPDLRTCYAPRWAGAKAQAELV